MLYRNDLIRALNLPFKLDLIFLYIDFNSFEFYPLNSENCFNCQLNCFLGFIVLIISLVLIHFLKEIEFLNRELWIMGWRVFLFF